MFLGVEIFLGSEFCLLDLPFSFPEFYKVWGMLIREIRDSFRNRITYTKTRGEQKKRGGSEERYREREKNKIKHA